MATKARRNSYTFSTVYLNIVVKLKVLETLLLRDGLTVCVCGRVVRYIVIYRYLTLYIIVPTREWKKTTNVCVRGLETNPQRR